MRGLELFESDRLGCAGCHRGFLFADNVRSVADADAEPVYHNTGLYNVGGTGAYPEGDPGLYAFTGFESDLGAFKAPSLRNVWLTAPYLHDGSIATLDHVLDHHAAGGRTITSGPNAGVGAENPHKDPRVTGFTLTDEERAAVLNFLNAPTDMEFVAG